MSAIGGSRAQRGSTLVEFSLSAFLLVMTLLSSIEMSRMLLVYTTVANAARVGARYAIVHGATRPDTGDVNGASGPGTSNGVTQVKTVVKNFASVGALDLSALSITVNYPADNLPGSTVIVTVVYPYDPFVGWFRQLSGLTLGSTTRGVITF